MGLSVYIHIPYCLQRCRYCDFTTFEANQIMPPEQYVELVRREIRGRHFGVSGRELSTIYFGGGTPSLLRAELIVAILHELANVGFKRSADCEITLEINPATLDPKKIETYLRAGVNRFSVGAQTFNDSLLKLCGRRHTAEDTRETLRLLQAQGANYSFDLLFALPGQTLQDLWSDLEEVAKFDPPHLSAYCLTVPEGHPMASGRPHDEAQVKMFDAIEESLRKIGLNKYEISNFAKPGFESRHNMAYWSDREYWGLGLSAHSYLHAGSFGVRFWNPKTFELYEQQVAEAPSSAGQQPFDFVPASQREALLEHEALTDYCHIHLRTSQGLDLRALRKKYSTATAALVEARLAALHAKGWLTNEGPRSVLTPTGQLLSNLAFAELLFLPQDLVPRATNATTPLPERPPIP